METWAVYCSKIMKDESSSQMNSSTTRPPSSFRLCLPSHRSIHSRKIRPRTLLSSNRRPPRQEIRGGRSISRCIVVLVTSLQNMLFVSKDSQCVFRCVSFLRRSQKTSIDRLWTMWNQFLNALSFRNALERGWGWTIVSNYGSIFSILHISWKLWRIPERLEDDKIDKLTDTVVHQYVIS